MSEPDIDDERYRALAWARFRRILRWMGLLSAAAAAGVVGVLWWWLGGLPVHVAIATALGVGLSVFLAAILMGLMFLSSGTGHDVVVDRFNAGRDPGRDPD